MSDPMFLVIKFTTSGALSLSTTERKLDKYSDRIGKEDTFLHTTVFPSLISEHKSDAQSFSVFPHF